jgi:hypothetical protein
MRMVRRVVATQHRPVGAQSLCIKELLRHPNFAEALNDGVLNDETFLIHVLKG